MALLVRFWRLLPLPLSTVSGAGPARREAEDTRPPLQAKGPPSSQSLVFLKPFDHAHGHCIFILMLRFF